MTRAEISDIIAEIAQQESHVLARIKSDKAWLQDLRGQRKKLVQVLKRLPIDIHKEPTK